MVSESDKELVRRIRAGDQESEKELFKRFNDKISKLVSINLSRSSQHWEDVVAETQIAVLISLRQGRYDPEKGISLSSYIYGITMNKIRDFYKFAKKEAMVSSEIPLETLKISAKEDADLEREELRQLLREAINQLKGKYKEVLYLRYYEELSIREISERLKLPSRRVSERIHYALKLLRKKCEKEKYFSILSVIFLILL